MQQPVICYYNQIRVLIYHSCGVANRRQTCKSDKPKLCIYQNKNSILVLLQQNIYIIFFPNKIAVKNSIDYFHPWKIQVLAKNEGLLVRLTALFTVENALSFEGTVQHKITDIELDGERESGAHTKFLAALGQSQMNFLKYLYVYIFSTYLLFFLSK